MSDEMTKQLQQFCDDLKDPNSETSKGVDKYIKELEENYQESLDFFESDEFFELFEEVKRHESIDEECLRYESRPEVKLTDEQFLKVYNSIWDTLEKESEDVSEYFETHRLEYGGYRWYMMHGQGTACWCNRIDVDDGKR